MNATTEIRLVVFDWAGTTIDFGCFGPVAPFMEVFRNRGVEVTTEQAREPMGRHKKEHIRLMLQALEITAAWRTARGRDWTEADVEEMYREAMPLQMKALEAHSRLVPGLVECVEELRRREIKIGGTTGYFREAAARVVELAKAQGYAPDYSLGADEVPAGRPRPWMLFRVMEAVDVYPPSAVVKVGDTVVDIAEGRNAGAWSVGVTDSSSEMGLSEAEFASLPGAEKQARREKIAARFMEAGADAVIGSVREVPALVDELRRGVKGVLRALFP